MQRPPLSIIAIVALTTTMAALQVRAHGLIAAAQIENLPPDVATPAAVGLLLYFGVKALGLWFLRRWAAVLWLIGAVINPILMSLDWQESWARYPLLGPFVSWFWFAVAALCIFPHWSKMTWRFP